MTGEKIKKMRWKHGLSQQGLANLAKVDRVTIAKAECSGKVSEKTMFLIEKAFKELDENVQVL